MLAGGEAEAEEVIGTGHRAGLYDLVFGTQNIVELGAEGEGVTPEREEVA